MHACIPASAKLTGWWSHLALDRLDHLWDNIPAVREDSAAALANAVRSYGQEALDKLLPEIR
jgi:hypothetical protein